MDKKNRVSVDIGGETYILKGDIDSARIIKVAKFVDGRLKEITKNSSPVSAAKIAVLTALNIADDYLRLEEDYKQIVKMLKENKK